MDYLKIDENNLTDDLIKKIFYSVKKVEYDEADYLIIYGCHRKDLLDERLNYVLSVLKSKKIEKIIVTGGVGKQGDFNESVYMVSFLVENGIDRNKIIIEDKSTTTQENNINIMNLLNLNTTKRHIKIILCTQEPHLVRIILHWNRLINNSNVEFLYDYPENSIISYENIINNETLRKEISNQMSKIKYFIKEGVYKALDDNDNEYFK